MVKTETIQYAGVDNIDPHQKWILDKLATEYYQKFKRSLQNITSMSVHIKAHENEGTRKKYSIHIKLHAPTKIFASTKGNADWDLARALHKAFKNIEQQIRHRFRKDSSRDKGYE